ncbi:hypothetical protein VTK26DRAFT_639 [Humicola hyalothermophila]
MSSSRLTLGATGLFSARTSGWTRTSLRPALRSPVQSNGPAKTSPFNNSRFVSRQARQMLENAHGRLTAQPAPKLQLTKRMQENLGEMTAEAMSIILPGTFVLPPLSQFPKPIGQKLRLLGQWILVKGQEIITNTTLKFMSKPTIFKRARFKPKRSAIIPTAKALHRSMAEALAAGDKDTINRVCSRQFGSSLLASIDARPRSRKYGWELVSYTNKMLYPSVKSHRISPLGREKGAPIIRQAVVAISSRQRRVAYDQQGNVIPGSEKEMDVVENVVIAAMVNAKTWVQSEWRVLGTIKPTTLEAWEDEKKLVKAMMEAS